MKLSVDQPPPLKQERRLPREQVEEPGVERPRQVRVLVEVGEEPRVEVRPVGAARRPRCSRSRPAAADRATNAAQKPTRITTKTAICTRSESEGEQEQERVAEADLRQRVFERPVGLRRFRSTGGRCRGRSGAGCARRRGRACVPNASPLRAPAGDRERQRRAGEERERRLNQVVERAPLPRHVRGVERHDRPERAVGKRLVKRPQAAALQPASGTSRSRGRRRST